MSSEDRKQPPSKAGGTAGTSSNAPVGTEPGSSDSRGSQLEMDYGRPSDSVRRARTDTRAMAVFRQWLMSMATDAEAALAAAMAYRELSDAGRDQWLQTLEEDLETLNIPRVAVYAPLLAVENDPERRCILESRVAEDGELTTERADSEALIGQGAGGERVYVLISPLYLDFVQVLACGVQQDCFCWARHDPIVARIASPVAGDRIQGANLESVGYRPVMDELAAIVLSHQKKGRSLPEAIFALSDMLVGLGP